MDPPPQEHTSPAGLAELVDVILDDDPHASTEGAEDNVSDACSSEWEHMSELSSGDNPSLGSLNVRSLNSSSFASPARARTPPLATCILTSDLYEVALRLSTDNFQHNQQEAAPDVEREDMQADAEAQVVHTMVMGISSSVQSNHSPACEPDVQPIAAEEAAMTMGDDEALLEPPLTAGGSGPLEKSSSFASQSTAYLSACSSNVQAAAEVEKEEPPVASPEEEEEPDPDDSESLQSDGVGSASASAPACVESDEETEDGFMVVYPMDSGDVHGAPSELAAAAARMPPPASTDSDTTGADADAPPCLAFAVRAAPSNDGKETERTRANLVSSLESAPSKPWVAAAMADQAHGAVDSEAPPPLLAPAGHHLRLPMWVMEWMAVPRWMVAAPRTLAMLACSVWETGRQLHLPTNVQALLDLGRYYVNSHLPWLGVSLPVAPVERKAAAAAAAGGCSGQLPALAQRTQRAAQETWRSVVRTPKGRARLHFGLAYTMVGISMWMTLRFASRLRAKETECANLLMEVMHLQDLMDVQHSGAPPVMRPSFLQGARGLNSFNLSSGTSGSW